MEAGKIGYMESEVVHLYVENTTALCCLLWCCWWLWDT